MTEELRLDYSKKDYELVLQDLKELIPTLTDDWTDFQEQDVGWAIVRITAAIMDMNHFYLDRQAAETYLSTCSSLTAATEISKMLGYTPRGYSSAKTIVKFELVTSYNKDIIIPYGTVLKFDNKVFHTTSNAVLLSGNTFVEVNITQGQRYYNKLSSVGIPWYKVILPINVSDLIVHVDSVEWEKVDSFIYTTNPNCFKESTSELQRIIQFGGGITAKIPEQSSVIEVFGVISDGFSGNINISNLSGNILDNIKDADGTGVTNLLNVEITQPAINGDDPESIESIKANAPGFFTAQNRAVTPTDFEFIVKSLVPGVRGVSAWGGEEVNRYGEVFISVFSTDPLNVPQNLLDSVMTTIEPKSVKPLIINVVPPSIIYTNLNVTIFANKFSNFSDVQNFVSTTTANHFDNFSVGQIFKISDLIVELSANSSINYVNLNFTVFQKGLIQDNTLKIEIPNNVDETSFQIYTEDETTLLWSIGDGDVNLFKNNLQISTPNTESGDVVLKYSSLLEELYLVRNQLMYLNNVDITVSESL